MESSLDLSGSFQSIPQKKEILHKAFGDLETQRNLIARCTQGWEELDQHLTGIHTALEKRYEEILEKEKIVESKTKEMMEKEKVIEAKIQEREASLDKRESLIETREQASLARVQEQKEAAVAAIREQRRKWIEERQLLQNQSCAKPDLDAASTKQKQKDIEANLSPKMEPSAKGRSKEGTTSKGSSKDNASPKINPKSSSISKTKKVQDDADSMLKPKDESKMNPALKLHAECSSPEASSNQAGATSQGKDGKSELNLDLTNDSRGDAAEKHKQTNDNQERNKQSDDKQNHENCKGSNSGDHAMEEGNEGVEEEDEEGVKPDGSAASPSKGVSSSVEPRPQLKALCEKMDASGLCTFITMHKKDFSSLQRELPCALKYASDPTNLVLKALEGYYSAGQGSEIRPTKIAIRKTCITLMEALVVALADGSKEIPASIKGEAKRIADQWKTKLDIKGSDQVSLMDAQCFLQLLSTFFLAREYSEDELCDIVAPICTRRHVPALWRNLGMAAKSPDVVNRLIKCGKQLDAVAFVHEFQLSEQFPPVPLLKAYLKDIRKLQSNKNSSQDQNQLLMKELGAVKEVIKYVQKYNLEAAYPTDGLHKRVIQLERRNPDKKRNLDAACTGAKKMRTNGPGGAPTGVPNTGQFRNTEKPHFGGRGMGGRNSYGSPHGGGGRGGGYSYPGGRSSYGSPSFPHGNYQYGGPPSSYHGSYMH